MDSRTRKGNAFGLMTISVSRQHRTGRIDAHVHMVGNGFAGSGGWLRLSGWHRWLAGFMLRQLGVPASALDDNLESIYAGRLVEFVRDSSMDAIVLLAHERVHDRDGHARDDLGSMFVPNDVVLGLAKTFPEFLAGVSIHPGRSDAIDELERCLAGGAVLMKCLPNCQNIDCNDRRFTRFWERMAEARLPLLAHTGDEHTIPVFCREYADPRVLALPLECGVNVIAAHCATRSGLFDPEYFHICAGMTRRFLNLYGDTSAFNVPIRGRHIPECLREPLASRMVHGSDYPVPVHGHWAWLRGHLDYKTFRRCAREKNILERDYQLKLAM